MKHKKNQNADESFDLSQLCTPSPARGSNDNFLRLLAEQDEYRRKYGENWYAIWQEHVNPSLDYDDDIKVINQVLYDGGRLHVSGTGPYARESRERFVQQAHEVYGDAFDRLKFHKRGDPEVVELLLKWAERTGKWKELPDCLQPMYHGRNKEELL